MTKEQHDAQSQPGEVGSSDQLGLSPMEQLLAFVDWDAKHNPGRRHIAAWAAEEIERLHAALAKANEQAERFERGWYLRGDALEGVLPYMEAAETAGLVGDEGCHWPVEAVRLALKA